MIKAIISDFDGTLVDTYEANLRAYQKAYQSVGKDITNEQYRRCFGLRFERLMAATGINDFRMMEVIRESKRQNYPYFFKFLRPNEALIDLISGFRAMGGKTAIASTARRENLMNAVDYLGITTNFDLIYTGEDVKEGKPSPEIYLKAMDALCVLPQETLIFEDSPVGVEAAKASGARVMVVSIDNY